MLPPPSKGGAAVVTGASSGIGEEFAREFARRGYQLVLVARRADRLRAIAESLGGEAHVLPVDLSAPAERATLPDQVAALGLVADILVNNAGMSNLGPVAASDPEAELRLIEVDVSAVVDLCSRFVPGMVDRGRGAVLNVASVGAFGPVPGQATYGAAKAFVLSYTDALGRSCAARASRRPRCVRARFARGSVRGWASPMRRPRSRCRSSCGRRPTRSPRRASTGWLRESV